LKKEFALKIARQQEIDNSRPDKQKITNEYRLANEEKDAIQARLGSLQGLLEAVSEQGKALRVEADQFQQLGIGACPKCKNEVTEEHKHAVQEDYDSKLKVLRERAKEYREGITASQTLLTEKKSVIDKLLKLQDLYNVLTEEKNAIIEKLKSINDLVAAHQVSADNSKAQLVTYKEEAARLQIETEDLRNKVAALGGPGVTEKHKGLVESLRSANAVLETFQQQIATFTVEANLAQSRTSELEELIEKATSVEKETEQLRKELGWLEVLQQDFQKTIPTMILENSAVMIETELNKCLTTLSDGFSVSISTQYKNKTNDNVREVFDLLVTVGDRVRAFELLSGGEKFRIAFALRVALSIIQAQEAGVQIGAIFYDEPFVDLDEDGLDKIQEIFVYLSSIFEHQLAITHQTRLKETFNDIICIRKTKDGSVII
jgi:exonuclease SbcC